MKLKDYFTLGNLVAGFAAVIALFQGSFSWACYLIYIGYVFDVLDGPVARLTKQFDEFGGHFDTVSDYITNSIAISFIIYYAFHVNAGYHWLVAAAIGSAPFIFGTIRQAKGRVENLSYPCYWLGVPRPVAAIFYLAMLNSSMFQISVSPWREIAHATAAGLVILGSILHLSKIPFVAHHQRRWMGFLWFGMHSFLTGSPLSALVGWLFLDWPAMVYDYVFFCLICYLVISWTQIPHVDYLRIKAYLRGEPLIKPLVHRDNSWRSPTPADFFYVREQSFDELRGAMASKRAAIS